MSLLRMLVKKKAEENSVSTETGQQTSLESTGKTEPSLKLPQKQPPEVFYEKRCS